MSASRSRGAALEANITLLFLRSCVFYLKHALLSILSDPPYGTKSWRAIALEPAKGWGAKRRAMYLNLQILGGYSPSSPPSSGGPACIESVSVIR